MLDIQWKSIDRNLIDKTNLKFPRFYLQKISGDIVLFFTKTKAAFLKPIKNGYELDSVYSGFCECTDDEHWQPIDVVLSNTSLTFGQEVVKIDGFAGIVMGDYTDLGDHRIVGQYKFLVLTPEIYMGERNFSGPDIRNIWTYVKISISHTDEISIVGYQEKP